MQTLHSMLIFCTQGTSTVPNLLYLPIYADHMTSDTAFHNAKHSLYCSVNKDAECNQQQF